jgi:hypothetical protein
MGQTEIQLILMATLFLPLLFSYSTPFAIVKKSSLEFSFFPSSSFSGRSAVHMPSQSDWLVMK